MPVAAKKVKKGGKKGDGGTGKKKAKKGKLEAEKLRELEEQRQRDEEEARLLAEKNKKEKELREEKEREELEKIFEESLELLNQQKAELKDVIDARKCALELIDSRVKKDSDWKAFVECNQLPDPSSEKDINTYLSLLEEESLTQGKPTLDFIKEKIPEWEKLCGSLFKELCLALGRNKAEDAQRITKHLVNLQETIALKWENVTSHILQYADQFGRESNENFQLTASVGTYRFGVWGNMTKNPRFKTIEFPELNMSTGLPKPLALANVAIRMLYEMDPTVTLLYENQTKNKMNVIGGILYFDLVELPELPKKVDQWTIRQVLSPSQRLLHISYPFKKSTQETADDEEEEDESASSAIWPAQVYYPIPTNCYLHEESVNVMYWNSEQSCWDADGIEDVEIQRDSGQVTFRTIHFKPLALVQDAYAEFPLKGWLIEPVVGKENVVRIVVEGRLNTIVLDVKEGSCSLISPAVDFEEIRNNELSPNFLFKQLSRVGLNFMAPASLKNVKAELLGIKNSQVENGCISGVSLCINGFRFKQSQYNLSSGFSKVVFQCSEVNKQPSPLDVSLSNKGSAPGETKPISGGFSNKSKEGTPGLLSSQNGGQASADDVSEPEYYNVMYDMKFQVKGCSYQVGFVMKEMEVGEIAYKLQPGQMPHPNIYHVLTGVAKSGETVEAIKRTSPLLSRTVEEVLQVLKIFSFA